MHEVLCWPEVLAVAVSEGCLGCVGSLTAACKQQGSRRSPVCPSLGSLHLTSTRLSWPARPMTGEVWLDPGS